MNNQTFWIWIHPATLLAFALAAALSWKTERRAFLLGVLGVYIAVLVWTALYFVPEQIAIKDVPFSATVEASLVARAAKWEALSFVRLALLVVCAFALLTGLSKPAVRSET